MTEMQNPICNQSTMKESIYLCLCVSSAKLQFNIVYKWRIYFYIFNMKKKTTQRAYLYENGIHQMINMFSNSNINDSGVIFK